jgi:hypothetical protein
MADGKASMIGLARFIGRQSQEPAMSDTVIPAISIAITPMHRSDEGIWESGAREGAALFLVELVQGDGADAEVVVECKNERTAALAARVAAATAALLGLSAGMNGDGIEAFDEDTAAILAAHETPEVALPTGEWRGEEDEDDDEDDEEEDPAPEGGPRQ